jgi:hypothetical protein
MWFDPSEGLNPQDLVDRIHDFWDTIHYQLSSDLTINVEPQVDSVNSATGEVTSTSSPTAPAAVVGSASADNLPAATQLLVQLRTGVFFGGRELRGRMFIPGGTTGGSADGKPTSSFRTFVGGAAQSLADDTDQVVYSPTKHQFADVSTTPVWTEWAVLRSRRD